MRLLVIAACGFNAELAARRSAHLGLARLVPDPGPPLMELRGPPGGRVTRPIRS
jgi:hypothetical protein